MNQDHDDIARLLRSAKPAAHPPVDLEGRIIRAIAGKPQADTAHRPWLWTAMSAAACLMLAAILVPHTPSDNPKQPAAVVAPTPALPPDGSLPLSSLANPTAPLEAENGALARDFRRAGGFLLDCMPSLGVAER